MIEPGKAVHAFRDAIRELVQPQVLPNEMEMGITRAVCIGMLESHIAATGTPVWRRFSVEKAQDLAKLVRADMTHAGMPEVTKQGLLRVLRQYGVVLVPTFDKAGHGIPVMLMPRGTSQYYWLGVNAHKAEKNLELWLAYGLGLCLAQGLDGEAPLFAADFAYELLQIDFSTEFVGARTSTTVSSRPHAIWTAVRRLQSPLLDALVAWHRQRGTVAPKMAAALFGVTYQAAELFSSALLALDSTSGVDLDADFLQVCSAGEG